MMHAAWDSCAGGTKETGSEWQTDITQIKSLYRERNGVSRSGERNWIIIITIEEKESAESRKAKRWLTEKCGDIAHHNGMAFPPTFTTRRKSRVRRVLLREDLRNRTPTLLRGRACERLCASTRRWCIKRQMRFCANCTSA